MVARHPRAGGIRLSLLFAGTVLAAAGLVRGGIAVRKSPLHPDAGELESLMTAVEPDDPLRPPAVGTVH